ncbi:hypothetical protein DQ244_08425 [Blastococcus sp. TBT05-19]|uniref:DUF881 domain-containing protein n=1 Tax=Blastococcus sp. TBT05-19 TaxID=2250581 RepID=UPI000DE86B73|nr:DUF881 domain-containing protein [Blastococcus sp. TBT05-19]RBY92294.1 hypothetical protein DQ244_08425 [Blastococcus sp. TBT05-19]
MSPSLLRRRPSAWGALVPVVALAAGLLFATSGRTAQGTDLRAGEITQLSELIRERDSAVARQAAQLTALQRQVQELTDEAASRNGVVAEATAQGASGAPDAGLTPVSGTGVVITLDDAPPRSDGKLPNGARPDDVVIHQSDVQAVVNAVWAAGAEGVAVMDQRLISTSAVRCVGNTLLLQGRTYSPPFVVSAVVDASAVRSALSSSPQIGVLRQAAEAFGLTFEVRDRPQVTVPAYDGGLTLQYASAG